MRGFGVGCGGSSLGGSGVGSVPGSGMAASGVVGKGARGIAPLAPSEGKKGSSAAPRALRLPEPHDARTRSYQE